MRVGGGWVLEVDIRKYFDTVDHAWLRTFLHRRVRDGVVLRLIGKWLNAGVMEGGSVSYPDRGTPQGGVISPLLANVYLHEVLDTWWEREVRPRLRGRSTLVRYADDFVLVFQREDDAQRVQAVLSKRFEKHGLQIHPEKTRLVRFRKPLGKLPPPGQFDLLGFTLRWERSLKKNWVVKARTAKSRFRRGLQRIALWCRFNRHEPIRVQQRGLALRLRGHDAYYGITGNFEALQAFRWQVHRIWRKWLSRRSQRGYLSWERFGALMKRFPLPRARVVHSIYRAAANA